MKVLGQDCVVRINGKIGYAATADGYLRKNYTGAKLTEMRALTKRNREANPHYDPAAYILQRGNTLCADKGFYERQRAEAATAVDLINGEIVQMDGKPWKVVYKGNYSDMCHLIEVEG